MGTFGFIDRRSQEPVASDNYDHTLDSDRYYHVVNMTRHSHWKSLGDDEFRHDMALLFLDRPPLGPHNHVYVKLNRDPHVPDHAGEPLTAMGVGWTSSDYQSAKKSKVLREVELEYLPNDMCELSSDADDNIENGDNSMDDDDNDDDSNDVVSYMGRIHSDHLCTTGGPDNTRDAW